MDNCNIDIFHGHIPTTLPSNFQVQRPLLAAHRSAGGTAPKSGEHSEEVRRAALPKSQFPGTSQKWLDLGGFMGDIIGM